MDYRHLRVEPQQYIVTVRLDRPAQRNALNLALMAELTDFARTVRRQPQVGVVILCGSPEYFSAGADLRDPAWAEGAGAASALEIRCRAAAGPDMCQAWEEIEAVTIAAIEGHCVGGGVALVAACDFRILGATASMRLPEVPLGLNMSWQSLPRLASLVGPARAKRLAIFGEAIDATTLEQWGLADEVVAAGQAEAAARRWAERVVALPQLPVRMTKEAVNAASGALHRATSQMDRDQFVLAMGSEDFRARVEAFRQRGGAGQA